MSGDIYPYVMLSDNAMSLPSTDDIVEDIDFFDDWEERYKYIIDLGKSLPAMEESLHTTERLVKGCQSNVWIDVRAEDNYLRFIVDSDAIIVRGLLALVMAAYSGKTAADIVAFDIVSVSINFSFAFSNSSSGSPFDNKVSG